MKETVPLMCCKNFSTYAGVILIQCGRFGLTVAVLYVIRHERVDF